MSLPTIENATVEARYNSSNTLYGYRITPNEGFVLHTKNYDTEVFDEETLEPTGEILLGFTSAYAAVGYNYDFDNVVADTYTYTDENGMTVSIPINKVGRFEIFAIPASIVPENQIFGSGNNGEHEVM